MLVLTTAALGASVVLEVLVHVQIDGVVGVGWVTGASDDTAWPLRVVYMQNSV